MRNEKQDLREYSDAELSMMVFNDEGLYLMRRNKTALFETLNELFIFTKEQARELELDLEEDEEDELDYGMDD